MNENELFFENFLSKILKKTFIFLDDFILENGVYLTKKKTEFIYWINTNC